MKKASPWDTEPSWEAAEKVWDDQAQKAEKEHPLKVLKTLPKVPGITEDAKKNITWKSFLWMIRRDHGFRVARHIIKKPIKHFFRYLRSLFTKEKYVRDGDFFFYGLSGMQEFQKLLLQEDTLFVVGFSYCEKPHECPSKRFTPDCIRDLNNPVCQQCFVGKAVHTLPENSIPLFIPTVHYIGEKMFEIIEKHPKKRVLFLITACEMTLEMFSDWGNMAGLQGIGVRLDGRICNTMQAFKLSEEGIKPGLTVLVDETKNRFLALLRMWRNYQEEKKSS